MRLKLVRVQGYKRFGERSSLDTRGRVVAIVGPNEAGKTSLLRAMEHISTRAPFDVSELTDRKQRSAEDWVIEAHFSLEATDRELLGRLVPAGMDLTYTRVIHVNGDPRYSISPALPRDRTQRARAARALAAAVEKGWIGALDGERDSGEEETSLADRARELASGLTSEADELAAGVRDELGALATLIAAEFSEGSRKSVRALVETLRATAAFEGEPPPSQQINDILEDRIPPFLLFGGHDRELHTEYAWAEHATPPPALANLFALAKSDYAAFHQAAVNDDRATVDTLREAADRNLDEAFRAWNQGDVHVALSPDKDTLQIMVRDRAASTRTRLDDRSDGLRAFVALIAFVARYAGDVRPVLLIDEAETHLHYGAQADLIRVFERQQAAETVIYTTHSIGCLPADLGASIRAVSQAAGELRRSTIRNSIWSGVDRVGLTPMMLAMGATALAFTPSRRAVIGEGPCEAILLPTLIRDALPEKEREEPLGYQVAPGVSEVNPEDAADLEIEAGAVAYLIDGDAGGLSHRRKLPERAKREGRVVVLGTGKDSGLCIEDLVRADILAEAFNRIVTRRAPGLTETLTAADLPSVGRATWLSNRYRDRKIGTRLNKVDLAQEALDLGRERGSLVEPARAALVRALHKKLLKATERPDDAVV